MGLAASQARLLLLTARLSDTEYQAQMISQRRMALAMQTEQIATEYSRKLNNRTLKFIYDINGNDGSTDKEALTYSSLTSENSHLIGNYRVTLPDGRVAVPSVNDIPNTIFDESQDEAGNTYYTRVTSSQIINALTQYVEQATEEGKDVSDVTDLLSKSSTWTSDDLNNAYSALKKAGYTFDDSEKIQAGSQVSYVGEDGTKYVVIPGLNNQEFFQNALRTGALAVEKDTSEVDGQENWTTYDLLHSDVVQDDLYTEDDAAAAAEYESKSAMIKSQDQMLEIQLKQVETQHSAAQTEYESVKKVIDKNIERSFKTFG